MPRRRKSRTNAGTASRTTPGCKAPEQPIRSADEIVLDVQRQAALHYAAHRFCTLNACRRAKRCADSAVACREWLWPLVRDEVGAALRKRFG